jgi:beta-lactamase superfamily II metal-dependent hydrolase
MFPARHGDAFLIRIAVNGRTTNVLVDAGLSTTYRDSIRPRLATMAAAGEDLRVLIVTHIDADHIEGAIAFLEDNGSSSAPSVIKVQEVWHNSYRHLFVAGAVPTPDQVSRVQQQVAPAVQATTGDISARQGSTLAALIRRHDYSWNATFGGEAVAALTGPRRIPIGDGVWLTLLSPQPDDLLALTKLWRRELLAVGVPRDLVNAAAFEEAFERMIERESETSEGDAEDGERISSQQVFDPPPPSEFREDQSKPNASSIAFVLEIGSKRVLFLGDAWPSKVAAQLRRLAEVPLDVLAVKVAHHGSRRNTSPELCSAFRARHGLISTDGSKHGHPDMEALLWLISSQPGITLYFNYPSAASHALSTPELLQRYGHRIVVGGPTSSLTVAL